MASIFYRKNRGCWFGQATVDGRRVKRKFHPNKKKSEGMFHRWVVELESAKGRHQFDTTITLQEFVDLHYFPWLKGAKSSAMQVREKLTVRTWIEVNGDCRLCKIDRRMAARFQSERRKKVKARTVNHDVGVISFVLKKAVEWKILEVNPLVGLAKLRETQSQPRWLTSEEIDALMTKAPDRLKVILITFLNTGLRKGELIRLEWKDVDLNGAFITVRHKGEVTTKSKKERTVDLNTTVVDALRIHRQKMKSRFGKLPQHVFVTGLGSPMKNNLYRDIRLVFKDAGIEGAKIHSLRHTFGSQAVMAGMDLVTLQKLMGHSDIKTTMIYAHVDRAHMRSEVNRLALGVPKGDKDVASLSAERAKRAGQAG